MKQTRFLLVWSLFTFCLTLCTGVMAAQTSAPADKAQNPAADRRIQPKTDTAPAASPEGQPATGGGAAVDPKTYKVGPQDVLRILVWHETEFTGLYTVHSDGKITLPLVGDLDAANLTPEEIGKNVAKALTKYMVNPLVTVNVQQVLSKKYYMDGEIARPGEYPLAAPTTVLEAISIAGGFKDFANQSKIIILRGSQQIRFNYKEVTRGKNLEQNIPLQSGDHVIVH